MGLVHKMIARGGPARGDAQRSACACPSSPGRSGGRAGRRVHRAAKAATDWKASVARLGYGPGSTRACGRRCEASFRARRLVSPARQHLPPARPSATASSSARHGWLYAAAFPVCCRGWRSSSRSLAFPADRCHRRQRRRRGGGRCVRRFAAARPGRGRAGPARAPRRHLRLRHLLGRLPDGDGGAPRPRHRLARPPRRPRPRRRQRLRAQAPPANAGTSHSKVMTSAGTPKKRDSSLRVFRPKAAPAHPAPTPHRITSPTPADRTSRVATDCQSCGRIRSHRS